MRNLFTRSHKFNIGDKPVYPDKITIAQWKVLFRTVDAVPQLIVETILAPKDEKVAYAVVAIERSIDEVIAITSVLTGIEAEYIEQNASIDQLIAYFTELVRINDFSSIVKNVKSVLVRGETEDKTGQDAE